MTIDVLVTSLSHKILISREEQKSQGENKNGK